MTLVLGINAYHADSAACLVDNGIVVAAVEEERITRVKHWAGFPSSSIRWCLDSYGVTLQDVKHIAINSNPARGTLRKTLYSIKSGASVGLIAKKLRARKQKGKILDAFSEHDLSVSADTQVHYIEHHLAHMASAYLASTFKSASIISVDGFGDFSSTAIGLGKGSNIKVIDRIYFPHSLGILYTALTQWLGFPNYGDEYKVMGLAPYGSSDYVERLSTLVNLMPKGRFKLNLKYFRHSTEDLKNEWSNGRPLLDKHYSSHLVELLGLPRAFNDAIEQKHLDVAYATQALYEKCFMHMLRYLHSETKVDSLCIAGGCGANSVANGKITSMTPFKNIFVQPAPGDAGGAIGAALVTSEKVSSQSSRSIFSAYLGPSYTNEETSEAIEEFLRKSTLPVEVKKIGENKLRSEEDFLHYIALSIANGGVVGWFQGRAEWGPRALGNRSILADPRRKDMQEVLNKKIKRRESFRPFAPSILSDHASQWFETDQLVPHMMSVYPIIDTKRLLIPAVCHVDGSGRLQTVSRSDNNRYYDLIKTFYDLTDIPILLNTSFNENEPIVCTPLEALACFARTEMDMLVLGDNIIERVEG